MYRFLRAFPCNRWCIVGASDVQITACSTVKLAVYWWLKFCTNYCMQYSATGGVLMVHLKYKLLHAVKCNWRWIAGSSDVQITACITIQLAVYWWIKWCTEYCLQCSATSGIMMVQVKYKLLHAMQCYLCCNDGSSDVEITACSTLQLAVYLLFKCWTDYYIQYSAPGGDLMVQVMYILLYATLWNWLCINDSSFVQITACIASLLVVH